MGSLFEVLEAWSIIILTENMVAGGLIMLEKELRATS